MPNHLTPEELANEVRMDSQEVVDECLRLGVPILHGRVDKTLFVASLIHEQQKSESGEGRSAA